MAGGIRRPEGSEDRKCFGAVGSRISKKDIIAKELERGGSSRCGEKLMLREQIVPNSCCRL